MESLTDIRVHRGTPEVPPLTRRRFLTWAAAASATCGLTLSFDLWADKSKGKLKAVEQSDIGTTLTFHLKSAPYPKDADKYRDPTVMVFVPKHFRLPKNRYADMVIHFHGHHSTAPRAMFGHQLREQLYESKQNAILIVPQGPVMAVDSSFGQLEKRNGLRAMLSEMLLELRRAEVDKLLEKASLAGGRGVGALCASAHSGGYLAVASGIKHGGVNVNEVYLFDSLYGELSVFRNWVIARKGKTGRDRHKLISYYAGGKVEENSLELLEQLKKRGVKIYHEERSKKKLTRAQITKGTAIFIASPLAHGSTAYKNNNLRDCLYASCLKRLKQSDWFKDKNKGRKIDRRGG